MPKPAPDNHPPTPEELWDNGDRGDMLDKIKDVLEGIEDVLGEG